MSSRSRFALLKDISLALRDHVELGLHVSEVGTHSEVRTADGHYGVVPLPPEEPEIPSRGRSSSLLRYSRLRRSDPPVLQSHVRALLRAAVEEIALDCASPHFPTLTMLYSAGITDAKLGSWKKLLACGAAKRKLSLPWKAVRRSTTSEGKFT